MKLIPLDDQVVIEKDPAEDMTDGDHGSAVAIPEVAQERPMFGTVRAVGAGLLLPRGGRAPGELRPGDRVVFLRSAGTAVAHPPNQGEVIVAREEEILGVIEP